MKQQCPNCNTINPNLNAFCVNCGYSFRTVGTAASTGPLITSQPTPGLTVTARSNRGLIFTLAGMLAALMIALAAIILIATSGSKPPTVNNPIAAAAVTSPTVPSTTQGIAAGTNGQSSNPEGKTESFDVTPSVPNPTTEVPPTPTNAPTPTPTNTPTPTPTNTPTPTPTPTSTPTPTPKPVSNANKIAFVQPDDNDHWNIYTINFDGTGLTTLIHRDQDVICPAFSPDGQRIVYVLDYEKTRRQIRIVNADGTGDRALTDDSSRNEYPVWVDNQNIIFVSYRNYPSESGNSDIFQLNVDNGSEFMAVQHGGYPSKVGDLTTFTRFTGKYQQIFAMDSSGTRALEGFNSDFDFGMISPDGQRIVASQNYTKLFLLDRNGNKEQLTPDDEIAKDPVWSPDGRYVAYLLRGVSTSVWEINIIDVNTKQVRRLYTNGKLKSYLAWGR